MRAITGQGAYANLALSEGLADAPLKPQESALVTDVVSGACRALTTLDKLIEAASGRPLKSLQPAIVDLLRLGTYEWFSGRVPAHAVVNTYVDLARDVVGQRATGVMNAVLRRVTATPADEWIDRLVIADPTATDALTTQHPQWIVDEYIGLLGRDEALIALRANNEPAPTTLAVQPGASNVDEYIAAGATKGRWSPYAVTVTGDPSTWLRDGKATVQDEGSQLVCLALTRADAPDGDWLDACAGPGGKTALLAGLLPVGNLVAAELHEHRARMVRQAAPSAIVMVADATRPAWPRAHFTRAIADVPCTGLGALRRRPDARWRRAPGDIDHLHDLQTRILLASIESTKPGGVVAYVTCSPHRRETSDVVAEALRRSPADLIDTPALLPEVPECASSLGPRFMQLWPHRHGTDAMFMALLRVPLD